MGEKNNIADLMAKRGDTVNDMIQYLSKKIPDTHTMTMRYWISGRHNPKHGAHRRIIAEYLGVPVSDVFPTIL